MIPRPPIHCIRLRQMMMPWLRWLTRFMTVAPVVVKPDMASKKASEMDNGSCSMNMKGIMPNAENTIHTMAVSRNPSRLPILVLRGFMPNIIPKPVTKVMPLVTRNGIQSISPYTRHVMKGMSRNDPSMTSSNPMMRRSTGKLMVGMWSVIRAMMRCVLLEEFLHFVDYTVECEHHHAVAWMDDGVT